MTTGFFWQVRESIHKFIIELEAVLYLLVNMSNKQQRRGGIILNFTKGETFFISCNNGAPGVNLAMQAPPSCTLQKMAFLSPLVWARREYTWTLIWKKNWLIFFENYQGVSYSHRQSRKRMMSTFIISNITPIYKSSLENIFMLFMQGKNRNLVCIFSKQGIFWY